MQIPASYRLASAVGVGRRVYCEVSCLLVSARGGGIEHDMHRVLTGVGGALPGQDGGYPV